LGWLRESFQVIILSDTFDQFSHPLMRKLGWPTLFCHTLEIDPAGRIAGYRLRQAEGKKKAVAALHGLQFRVVAAGAPYKHTAMLAEADRGILFCPPANVIAEFPQFPVTRTYGELRAAFERAAAEL